jgi:hypothetical protein
VSYTAPRKGLAPLVKTGTGLRRSPQARSSKRMRPMASPYLYITDETGAEVPGSRRDVTGLTTAERIAAHRVLEQQAAEGCMVRHSEEVR